MNTKYFWVKFYPTASWELVKFWTKNNTSYIKGLDWATEQEIEKFSNKTYELGPEIFLPNYEEHDKT